MKKCIFYIIILILMLLPAIACADLYKYTEDSGTVVISNDIKRVPAKYKDTLVIIREDSNSSAQQTPSTSSTPPKLADEDNKNTTESLTNSITNILKKNNKQGSPDIAELKDSKLNDLSGMVGKDLNKMIYLIGFSIIGSIVSIFVVRLIVPKQPMRIIVTIIVMLLINLISFSSYIGPTLQKGSALQKGSSITKDIENIRNLTNQRPNEIEKALK